MVTGRTVVRREEVELVSTTAAGAELATTGGTTGGTAAGTLAEVETAGAATLVDTASLTRIVRSAIYCATLPTRLAFLSVT